MVAAILHRAATLLASRCDGACTQDGRGYSRFDADFGRRLASTPPEHWSPRMTAAAARMLRRYRAQLAEVGVQLPDLDLREIAGPAESWQVTREGDRLRITGPYDPQVVEALRAIPSRRWDGTANWIAAEHVSLLPVELRRLAPRSEPEFGPRPAPAPAPDPAPAPAPRQAGTVRLDRGQLVIETPYDPQVVEALRAVPSRRWDARRKVNVAATADVAHVVRLAERFGWTVDDEVRALLDEGDDAAAASEALDAMVEVPGLAGELLPFQRAGVAYAAARGRALIADDMGLGKTVQALATLQVRGAFPALVVCPASLKLNWQREAQRWLPGRSVQVVSGRKGLAPTAEIVIVNYDVLHARLEQFSRVGLRGLVLDEAHAIKNSASQRSRAARELAKSMDGGATILALTGTPVTNSPQDLVPVLQLLGVISAFGGVTRFRKRFLVHDGWGWRGGQNLDELHDTLRRVCMVRRRKQDVLTELPAKRRAEVPVEMSADARSDYARAEDDLIRFVAERAAWIAGRRGDDPTIAAARAAEAAWRAEALVRMTNLRRIAGVGKVPAALDLIGEMLEAGEPVVVFAHHRDVIDALVAATGGRAIVGGQSAEERQQVVDAFQAGEVQVLVASITAAGVGLTLTAASNAIFVEEPWTPAAQEQAEDRLHRIGQHRPVTAWHLVAAGTIDERLMAIIGQKRSMASVVHDGDMVEALAESYAS